LTYFPFNKDFGPLNLAMVHRFARELARLLKDNNYKSNRIFHYCTSEKPDKMVNGAFLMGAFMIIIFKCTAEKAYSMFRPYHSLFKPYRDASKGNCLYNCTLLQCLQGLEYAIKFKWYDFKTFNVKEYEFFERVENGDVNWIIPGKFMAFMGPIEKRDANQRYGHHPNKYAEIFQRFDVKRVVRLNEEKYDKRFFTDVGIAHNDLFFIDGSTPPDDIVEQFIEVCDDHFGQANPGAIAIHCKAGLGRTGTLIGLWAMKHFQIPAEPFIGWIRIARPGSILGPQQFYLPKMEHKYIDTQEAAGKHHAMAQKLESSPVDKHKAMHGETAQADYLIMAKEMSADKRSPQKRTKMLEKDEIKEEEDPSAATTAQRSPAADGLKIGSPIKAK
jgi:cell division cycle 14